MNCVGDAVACCALRSDNELEMQEMEELRGRAQALASEDASETTSSEEEESDDDTTDTSDSDDSDSPSDSDSSDQDSFDRVQVVARRKVLAGAPIFRSTNMRTLAVSTCFPSMAWLMH